MTCLNNAYLCMKGVCEETNATGILIGQCTCEQGWEDDNTMFHQQNCGIPTNALLAIFVVYGIVLTVPLLGLFARASLRARGRMKQTGVIAAISCLTFTATTLSMYLEKGMFEATSIIITVNLAVTNYISESVLMMILAPIVAARHRRLDSSVPRKLRMIMWAIRLILVAAGIVLAAVCRTDYFNYAYVSLLVLNVFLAVASSVPQLRYITLLQEAIAKSLSNTHIAPVDEEGAHKVSELMTRLSKSKKGLIAYCCHVFIFQFSLVGLFLGLGKTLPFVWCIWPLLYFSQFAKYYQCLVLFQQSSAVASVSQTPENAQPMQSRMARNHQEARMVSSATPARDSNAG